MIAETPLVKNLENTEYMNILLDGKGSLKECFSEIQHKIILEEFETANYNEEKIPTKIKKAIRNKDIPSIFLSLTNSAIFATRTALLT